MPKSVQEFAGARFLVGCRPPCPPIWLETLWPPGNRLVGGTPRRAMPTVNGRHRGQTLMTIGQDGVKKPTAPHRLSARNLRTYAKMANSCRQTSINSSQSASCAHATPDRAMLRLDGRRRPRSRHSRSPGRLRPLPIVVRSTTRDHQRSPDRK